jgi:uracil phosphoribosyltransferase
LEIFILNKQNTLANRILAEIRDRDYQQDKLKFRDNLEALGQILSYEMSRTLKYQEKKVKTTTGLAIENLPEEEMVIVTLLRAGLPLFEGVSRMFPKADCGFIGIARTEESDNVKAHLSYISVPDPTGKVLIVADTMLATGKSLLKSIEQVVRLGMPRSLHIISAIAAPEGVDFLQKSLKIPFNIWTGSLDQKLNNSFFIVPGLGDAGDLAYGEY